MACMINKKRLISLTQKIISINSENPPGNEFALAKFVEKDMRSLGLNVKTYSYADKRPNVIAILKGNLPGRKSAQEAILITPHMDTVPLGVGWKMSPLGGKIINGKLYGRGATDDKGNLASCMEVMRSLAEDRISLKKDIVMAATVDEESGSHYGIIPLLREKILKPRFALVLDSDEFDTIVVQKGLIHCRLQIFGKKSHGAYNWRGVNAVEIAANVIHELKKIKFKHKKHPLLRGPTLNVGSIQGGEKVNMVADFCEISLDMRFLPGMNPKEMIKIIKQVVKAKAKKYKLEIDALQEPYEIDKNNRYVKTYLQTAKKMKCDAKLTGCQGATVMSLFEKYKIPAFATGFGAHGTAHTNDEYIFVNTLYKGTCLLKEFIKNYDNLD